MICSSTVSSRNRLQNRSGVVLVFLAVSMVALMGMLVLTLDVGAGNRQRRILQTAADAGALAGGTQILRGISDEATITAAARRAVAMNVDTVGSGLTVSYPPATGPRAGDSMFVEVILTKSMPTLFGSIFSVASLNVRGRGVAGAGGISNNCLVSLAPTGTGLDLPGGAAAAGCSVVANSTDPTAIDIGNGKQIEAASVAAVGGINGSVTGARITGAPPLLDPFAYIQMPAIGACTFTSKVVVSGTQTLNPGVYCGGIEVGKNDLAILNPGTYVMRGGGLVGGGIRGTGVTIINANGPGNNPALYRPLMFPEACSVSLTAPTTGALAGIVMFQDPSAPTSGPNTLNEICGKGDNDIVGSIYFPNQTFTLGNGNGKLDLTGAIIAGVVSETNGGARLNIFHASGPGQGPKKLSLVE